MKFTDLVKELLEGQAVVSPSCNEGKPYYRYEKHSIPFDWLQVNDWSVYVEPPKALWAERPAGAFALSGHYEIIVIAAGMPVSQGRAYRQLTKDEVRELLANAPQVKDEP